MMSEPSPDRTDLVKNLLRNQSERSIEHRAKRGEFYTSAEAAQLAHAILRAVDPNIYSRPWYDPCVGGGALIQDCPEMGDRLWLSTLDPDDVEKLKAGGQQGRLFQHDFLNDRNETLPEDLQAALKQQPCVIMNPPFLRGTGGSFSTRAGERTNVAGWVLEEMQAEGMANASQAVLQFMFRTARLASSGSIIAVFSPTTWLTGKNFAPFRKWWGDRFSLVGGFIGRSKEFSGVTADWPFAFTAWRSGGRWDGEFGSQFAVYDRDSKKNLVQIGQKVVAPARRVLNDWIDRPAQTVTRPPIKGAFEVVGANAKKIRCDTSAPDAVGYIVSTSNDVRHASGYVYLLSEPDPHGSGWAITPANFAHSMVVFALRKLAPRDWHGISDEFEVPDVSHPEYQAFENDCVAWSLFHFNNYATSIGTVTYKEQLFEVKNHLFWIAKDRLVTVGYPQSLIDAAEPDHERFAALWLKQTQLSRDAESVVALATDVVRQANAFRDRVDPKFRFHDRWDAGWQQVRAGVLGVKELSSSPQFSLAYERFERSWLALGRRLAVYITTLGVLRGMV